MPKKITRSRKDEHVRAREEGDDTLLLDKVPNKKRKVSGTQTQSQYATQVSISPRSKSQRKAPKKAVDESETESDSATEPESDQELLLNKRGSPRNARLPTPSQSSSPDPGRAPGRIVGAAYPLEDFKKNIANGDLVTKAVEDLAFVIKDTVLRPFSSRRTKEMLQCMKELRKVASEVVYHSWSNHHWTH